MCSIERYSDCCIMNGKGSGRRWRLPDLMLYYGYVIKPQQAQPIYSASWPRFEWIASRRIKVSEALRLTSLVGLKYMHSKCYNCSDCQEIRCFYGIWKFRFHITRLGHSEIKNTRPQPVSLRPILIWHSYLRSALKRCFCLQVFHYGTLTSMCVCAEKHESPNRLQVCIISS
jgi:hypothetical protein